MGSTHQTSQAPLQSGRKTSAPLSIIVSHSENSGTKQAANGDLGSDLERGNGMLPPERVVARKGRSWDEVLMEDDDEDYGFSVEDKRV